jgi:tripartite-type tricarboxylate transporter receptor subunit TctC
MNNGFLGRGFLIALMAVIAAGGLATAAVADSFPSHSIRIIVGGGPGTPPDIITRVVANAVSEAEGWQFVIENKPGGGQTLAGLEVVRSLPDGYSLFAQTMPIAAAPALLANMPFNLIADFAPVIRLSASYNVLVVNPSVPANSVAELVALIKNQPDKLTFSSGGIGTPAHLAGELFKLQNDLRAIHVPYSTNFSNAIGDLLSGTNQYMFITTLPVVDLIQTGKLRALAVTAPKRVAVLQDVPTVVEQGFPNLIVEEWAGFSAKAGTPDEIVLKLNGAFNKALTTQKVIDAFAKIGAVPAGGTPESYGALIKQQVDYWGRVIKEAGIRVQ